MRLPLSLRRLFHQRLSQDMATTYGADLGFSGSAAHVPIDDDYQAKKLRRPIVSEERLWAANGFFMKRHRNAARLADKNNDEELRQILSRTREELADHLVVIGHQIKTEIEKLGYSESVDDWAGELPSGLGLPNLSLADDQATISSSK